MALEVRLLPYAPEGLCTRLGAMLDGLGYRLAAPTARGRPRLTIAAVGDELVGERLDSLARRLGTDPGHACVGVVSSSSELWTSDILERFTDVVGWPCHPRELDLRLKRVLYSVPACPRDHPPGLGRLVPLELVGRSPAFRAALRRITKVARSDAPVLIEGETGTGKELAARAIHRRSPRADAPFIAVNCGVLPDSLVENELFGHERGAYTDAHEARAGLVAQAHSGTLLLDEVEAMAPRGQVAMLRFLEEQEYRPLGGARARRADVRILACANAPLESLVEAGHFRRDLYYRLKILTVVLPPLRMRPDDVELLADHFLAELQARYRVERRLGAAARHWLTAQPWPGNVRELRNLLEREYLMAEGPTVELGTEPSEPGAFAWSGRAATEVEAPAGIEAAVADPSRPLARFNEAKASVVAAFERRYLTRLLSEAEGNVSLAARRAGKERRALGKLLKKHALASRDHE